MCGTPWYSDHNFNSIILILKTMNMLQFVKVNFLAPKFFWILIQTEIDKKNLWGEWRCWWVDKDWVKSVLRTCLVQSKNANTNEIILYACLIYLYINFCYIYSKNIGPFNSCKTNFFHKLNKNLTFRGAV